MRRNEDGFATLEMTFFGGLGIVSGDPRYDDTHNDDDDWTLYHEACEALGLTAWATVV